MAEYLLLNVNGQTRQLKLKGGQYPNTWQIVAEDGVTISTPPRGGLYINSEALEEQPVPSQPDTQASTSFWARTSNFFQTDSSPEVHYRLRSDEHIFADLYTRWRNSNLQLTRGVTGTHKYWNDLVNGTLRSEGTNDLPTFTMGNIEPISWLPCSFFFSPNEVAAAAYPAMQDMNNLTTQNAYQQAGIYLPAGAIVTVTVGQTSNTATCWLNSGEILVRGPLQQSHGEFSVLRIVSVSLATGTAVDRLVVPPGGNLLSGLIQRPFRPDDQKINDWISNMIVWSAEVHAETGVNFTNPPNQPV